jgi:hypothetical protein
VTHLIVSDLAVAGVNFDQGAVDGKGMHLSRLIPGHWHSSIIKPPV